MIYFVDDLNLPEVDKYGTQSAIALLRQHVDYGHCMTNQMAQMLMIVTLLPESNCRSFHVDPRLQRHFSTFAIAMPSAASLMTIYETFLLGHLTNGGFANPVQGIASALIGVLWPYIRKWLIIFGRQPLIFIMNSISAVANIFQRFVVATPTNFTDPEVVV